MQTILVDANGTPIPLWDTTVTGPGMMTQVVSFVTLDPESGEPVLILMRSPEAIIQPVPTQVMQHLYQRRGH